MIALKHDTLHALTLKKKCLAVSNKEIIVQRQYGQLGLVNRGTLNRQ